MLRHLTVRRDTSQDGALSATNRELFDNLGSSVLRVISHRGYFGLAHGKRPDKQCHDCPSFQIVREATRTESEKALVVSVAPAQECRQQTGTYCPRYKTSIPRGLDARNQGHDAFFSGWHAVEFDDKVGG